jgi:hypothetical protein
MLPLGVQVAEINLLPSELFTISNNLDGKYHARQKAKSGAQNVVTRDDGPQSLFQDPAIEFPLKLHSADGFIGFAFLKLPEMSLLRRKPIAVCGFHFLCCLIPGRFRIDLANDVI